MRLERIAVIVVVMGMLGSPHSFGAEEQKDTAVLALTQYLNGLDKEDLTSLDKAIVHVKEVFSTSDPALHPDMTQTFNAFLDGYVKTNARKFFFDKDGNRIKPGLLFEKTEAERTFLQILMRNSIRVIRSEQGDLSDVHYAQAEDLLQNEVTIEPGFLTTLLDPSHKANPGPFLDSILAGIKEGKAVQGDQKVPTTPSDLKAFIVEKEYVLPRTDIQLATILYLALERSGFEVTEEVQGIPQTVSECRTYLWSLDTINPDCVQDALKFFHEVIEKRPEGHRDACYILFRKFHECMCWMLNGELSFDECQLRAYPPDLPRAERIRLDRENADRTERLSSHPRLCKNGFCLRMNEGWEVVPDADIYVSNFGKSTSPAIRSYLELEARELAVPWGRDAGLCIPFQELGRRMAAWEDYLARYPVSPDSREAQHLYVNERKCLLQGIDNSRLFAYEGDHPLLPNVRAAYDAYIRDHPDTETGKLLSRSYELFKKHGFRWSEKLKSDFEAVAPEYVPMEP